MADPTPTGQSITLTIPDEIRAKFQDLIDLILASESMNDEERQYWINILPIMTPEQIEKLRGILVSEREQLSAIDAKYAAEIEKVGAAASIRQMEEERRKKRTDRTAKESTVKEREEVTAEELLKKIEDE